MVSTRKKSTFIAELSISNNIELLHIHINWKHVSIQ